MVSSGERLNLSELILPEEIQEILSNPVTVDPFKKLRQGNPEFVIPKIKPFILKSGYNVSFSIDIMDSIPPIYHLSIMGGEGKTDPADAEIIAQKILGKEFMSFGAINVEYVLHFYHCKDMPNLKRFLDVMRSKLERAKL